MESKNKLIRITTISTSLNILLKGQFSFLNQHYEVLAIASGTEGLREIAMREGIRTIEVDMKREISLTNDLKSLLSLIKIFYKEKPYIVHANTPKASLISMIAAWITKVPHRIYTVTGLRFETATGKFRWLLITMERITCWCATKVIPEGDGVKKTLVQNKITNKPLHKILNGNINGIDLEHYNRTSNVMHQASLMKNKGFTFIFIGRMVKDKGINELINAFVRLCTVNNCVHLLLVGPFEKDLNPIFPETERIILSHPNITYTGFQKDVRPYFAAADALVFPSYREGFPNVVLQAGAMGLPSIVTDINGCNEIIIEGENGMIIPPKDENALYKAMKYFVNHQNDKVREMAMNARPMIAERYEQHKVWEALLKEYQSLN